MILALTPIDDILVWSFIAFCMGYTAGNFYAGWVRDKGVWATVERLQATLDSLQEQLKREQSEKGSKDHGGRTNAV